MEYVDLYPATLPHASTERLTHHDLNLIAVSWLVKNGCVVAASEVKTNCQEIPDAWGLRDDGVSITLECKTSEADYSADIKKVSRNNRNLAMGAYRYYLITKDLLNDPKFEINRIPRGWGLLVIGEEHLKNTKINLQFTDTTIRTTIGEFKTPTSNSLRNLRGELQILAKICGADYHYRAKHLITTQVPHEYDF